MKKLLFALAMVFIGTMAIGQSRYGVMLGYGSRSGQPAVGGNLEFFIDEKISLSPSLLIYFPDSHNNIREFWMEVNFNGHYYFYDYDIFEFYGVGGLNYTYLNYKDKKISDNSYTSGNLNVNLGGGVNFKFKKLLPFSEIRYVIGSTNQAVVVAGLKFGF